MEERDLQKRKLELEVADLEKKWWKRPQYISSALLPASIAILSFFGLLLSGVFNTQRQGLEKEVNLLIKHRDSLIEQIEYLKTQRIQTRFERMWKDDTLHSPYNSMEAKYFYYDLFSFNKTRFCYAINSCNTFEDFLKASDIQFALIKGVDFSDTSKNIMQKLSKNGYAMSWDFDSSFMRWKRGNFEASENAYLKCINDYTKLRKLLLETFQ